MSFGILTVKNPIYICDERRKREILDYNEAHDFALDLEFEAEDFDALHNFLDIKFSDPDQRCEESYEEYEKRLRDEYNEAAKKRGYELLGRIWNRYESVIYFPSEVSLLLKECVKIKENSQNSEQLKAMNILMKACSEALQSEGGIFLGSD